MSLKSWKAEFYPVSARTAARTYSVPEMVIHSLTKWEGLKRANLKKHGLSANGFLHTIDNDETGGEFEIGTNSCALCQKFYPGDGEPCHKCPLFESLGRERCDLRGNPYHIWVLTSNPAPMIKALRKALTWAKKNS